jgi:hypothetical protein
VEGAAATRISWITEREAILGTCSGGKAVFRSNAVQPHMGTIGELFVKCAWKKQSPSQCIVGPNQKAVIRWVALVYLWTGRDGLIGGLHRKVSYRITGQSPVMRWEGAILRGLRKRKTVEELSD